MSENYNYAKSGNAQRKQMHYSPNLLSTINNAIDNCKVSFLEYDSREKGVSKREVEPMAIVYKDRKRHLVAFCRLRNEYRSFRLDRLNLIRLEKEEFARRQDFNVNDFQDSNEAGSAYEDYEEEN
jgi:predicted DNA-binding transcriptional regulator YafY